jgi:hypothetical protein
MPLHELSFSQENFYLVFFAASLGLMFVFVWVGTWVQKRRRSRQALEQARQLGFTLLPLPDPAFANRMRCAYPPSANVRVSNAAFHRQNELLIYLCDVTTTHRGENRRSQPAAEQGVVVLVSPLLNLPPFLLISRPAALESIGLVANMVELVLKQVGLAYGYRQVSFNIDSEFDHRYLLFTNNEEPVKTFFNDSLVSLLAQTSGYVVRASGDTLLLGTINLGQPKNNPNINQISERIDQAHQLYAWILDKR